MKKIVKIIDIAFITILFFIVNKIWFTYRLAEDNMINLYAILNTMLFLMILLIILKKAWEKKKIKEEELQRQQNIRQTLLLLSAKKYYEFISQIIKAEYPTVKSLGKFLYFTDDKILIIALNQKVDIPQKIDQLLILKAFIKINASQIIIIAPFEMPKLDSKLLQAKVISLTGIIEIMDKYEIDLKIKTIPKIEKEKKPFIEQLKMGIMNTHPVRSVLYALFWVIAAFSSRYGIYYMFIALIFAFIGLMSYILKNQSKKIL